MGLTMAEPRLNSASVAEDMGPEPKRDWYAAYTRSRHEATVAKQLEAKAVGFLLPTYAHTARWSDRLKHGTAPLFPSYVFVNVTDEERIRVLQTAGVVNIVSVAGKPYPLREEEVAMLQECVTRPRAFEPHPYLRNGQRVRVKQGPFAGWKGILSHKKNGMRLVISLENLMRSVAVDLAGSDIEVIN